MYPKFNVEASTSAGPPMTTSCEKHFKQVVIIGNGPSAISLSFMLSGNWPYYSSEAEHHVSFLHERLIANPTRSLFLQDLRDLCQGLEGRSDNPVSVLFDTLTHPEADSGVDLPSCLTWLQHPERHVDHVVIGCGLPGGSWQDMEQSSLTLSLETWMDMPSYTYKDWEKERRRERSQCSSLKRATVGNIARYYRDFVVAQQLEKNFLNHNVVTSVRRVEAEDGEQKEEGARGSMWEVRGHSVWDHETFCYVTPHVVMANGCHDDPNRLHVPGEDLDFVSHYSSKFENLITEHRLGPHSDPVLIVGAGLTAADAIITARFCDVPVAHVFRRDVNDPGLIFNRLPENMYPDYHKVHQMMQQRQTYRGYSPYEKHQLVEILPDHKIRIQGPDTSLVLKVSLVLILIGSKSNFSFLEPEILDAWRGDGISGRRNLFRVDAFTHQSPYQPGLFALGPLVGDNFVRFLQGGALAIASYLAQRAVAEDSAETVNDTAKSKLTWSQSSVDTDSDDTLNFFRWSRVLSCPEGIEVEGVQFVDSNENNLDQILQRRCRFRSASKRRQVRRRRASHSSCDKLNVI